jgi:hypothetical protein
MTTTASIPPTSGTATVPVEGACRVSTGLLDRSATTVAARS